MLYMIGAVQVDTFPFSANKVEIVGTADIAKKGVIGGIRPGEFTGDGGRKLSISGEILPHKIGGLSQLSALDEMRKTGAVIPVTRGDGLFLGKYAIKSVTETHSHLMRDGVGFVVAHKIQLDEEPEERPVSEGVFEGLRSFFDLL